MKSRIMDLNFDESDWAVEDQLGELDAAVGETKATMREAKRQEVRRMHDAAMERRKQEEERLRLMRPTDKEEEKVAVAAAAAKLKKADEWVGAQIKYKNLMEQERKREQERKQKQERLRRSRAPTGASRPPPASPSTGERHWEYKDLGSLHFDD